ncbi:MAG TPA: helix-turn-helix domain-containing protein [Vicinamibacterales bacterium]|jgi:DNA-binding NtrC family response regulator
MPPLRRRLDDVAALATHFAEKHAARNGWAAPTIEPDAIQGLREYHWPGNVRELENTIERAVVLSAGRAITRSAVAIEPVAASAECRVPFLRIRDNVQWAERETIQQALRSCRQKARAATSMGISPRALSYYLAKYSDLEAEEPYFNPSTT